MTKQTKNGRSCRQTGTWTARGVARLAIACGLLLGAGAARADSLKIENVTAAPRDAATATVKFDIAWENSWRWGSFHDAAWVFFKVRAEGATEWQHVRLAADKVLNPAGYGQEKDGTPLEFVVPAGDDGFVGMFVRRAADGTGTVAARGITAVWDFTANKGITKDTKVRMQAFGIEMVYVAEGPFYLGSGGTEWNRFYTWTEGSRDIAPRRMGMAGWDRHDDGQDTPPYRVTGAGAIPTGRQKGRLWAAGIRPEDGGEIPASFPNGYAAFYCMKYPYITQGQYAGFLNTLTPAQANEHFYIGGHGRWIGRWINRSGESPNRTYSASDPDRQCPWLSWADGAALAAWAGLRPMTELEYEKAIRGPQDPVPNDVTQSYWGVADIKAWHSHLYERPVSVGKAAGRAFAGTHGRGTPALPADWPADLGGAVLRGDPFYPQGHLLTSGRSDARDAHADRSPRATCWRGVRTAPAAAAVEPAPGQPDPRTVRPVARLGPPVRADGVLDEWGKPALTLNRPDDVFPVDLRFPSPQSPDPWRGPGDMSVKVYLGSDGEALCVAAEVADDRHFNAKTGDKIWNGDALRMGLVTAKGVHWNIGLALTQAGVAFHQWEGRGDTLPKTAGCAVARDDAGRTTRYELRLPLAALGLEPGAEFGFNLVFYDDDGNGQRYWLQLAPGLAGGSNIALYPRFVLAK